MNDERPQTEEEKVKETLQEQAYHVERRMSWNRGDSRRSFPGLCGTCKYLRLASTQYGGLRRAMCSVFEMGIDPRDPIDECTEYWKRGQLNLSEMVDRARLIGSVGKAYADERLYL